MSIQKFNTDFVFAIDAVPAGRTFFFAKRAADIIISILLLPTLAFFALILSVVCLFDSGSLIFSQNRVGQRGKIFKIYKFRTMTCQGEARPARFAPQEQDRISRIGRFLRSTRIDELPQIINVLKGEMSLVGPRPEQVAFYRMYEHSIPGYARRQLVRPGITGLAQLKYGYTSDEAGTTRKLKWDLAYITRQGFLLESYIMLLTCLFVLGRLLHIPTRSKL
ncbi:sugar transferase [Planktotalea sp.]|uniref:sugar transferase n=1 Tax=Planktotalea sp. TaxID=2029877 RepID=UPI003D6C29AE